MGLSLSAKTVGPPHNTFEWYLHSSGGTLAAGFPVSLGNGDETPLFLDADGIGTRNAGGFKSMFRTAATADREINLPDGDVTLYPELLALLGADAANSTTSAAAVADFSVPLEAGGLYEFEMLLLFKSAATGTSPRFSVEGPAETSWVYYDVITPPASSGVTSLSGNGTQAMAAWGTDFANSTTMPAANTPVLFRVKGMALMSGSAPVLPVSLEIWSEVGASAITLMANSLMRFRKLN